jgi:hypothetical protein
LKDLIPGPFLIQGSGFTRELHNAIAYKEGNPLLSELPGLLNFGSDGYEVRGFEAEYFESLHDDKRLHDFFGGCVSPDSPVLLESGECAMRLVLPPVPPERLFDDCCQSGVRIDSKGGTHVFVLIELDPAGAIHVRESGALDPENKCHSDVLQQLPAGMSEESDDRPSAPHVRAIDIILAIFDEWSQNKTDQGSFLRIGGVRQDPKRPSRREAREVWAEIDAIFRAVNPLDMSEIRISTMLSRLLGFYSKDQWIEKIREVRDALLLQKTGIQTQSNDKK